MRSGKSFSSWCDGSSDQSFMVGPLRYLLNQPVLHDWCNKGRGMCYLVCGMMHTKEPLLLIGKSSSGFPLSLSVWFFTICLTPYNRKYNVLSTSLNKTCPSFLLLCFRGYIPRAPNPSISGSSVDILLCIRGYIPRAPLHQW